MIPGSAKTKICGSFIAIRCGERLLEYTHKVKMLGAFIDSRLPWKNHVVLSVIQRVIGSNHDQILFRELLLRLCNGEITQNDWKQLLRQPRKVSDIDQFKDGSHIIPMQK